MPAACRMTFLLTFASPPVVGASARKAVGLQRLQRAFMVSIAAVSVLVAIKPAACL